LGDRVLDLLTAFFVNNVEDVVQRFSRSVLRIPAGQFLRDRVREGDGTLHVSDDHGVANAGKRDAKLLPVPVGAAPGVSKRLAKSHNDGAGQRVEHEPDDGAEVMEAEQTARRNEEVGTGDVAEDPGEHGLPPAAVPNGE